MATLAIGASVLIGLNARGTLDAGQEADPSTTAGPAFTAATASPPVVAGVPQRDLLEPPRRPEPLPTPTAAPTLVPTPVPTPVPVAVATPVPVQQPAAPTPDYAGGPLAPRTAPPGWSPPLSLPGDVWTDAAFGQTASRGGISISVSRLPPGTDAGGCNAGNQLPPGTEWAGFSVRTSWSGFPIPVWETHVPNDTGLGCWVGDPPPIVSGVTYQVFSFAPIGSTPAYFRIHLFPNGSSPAYIFEFR